MSKRLWILVIALGACGGESARESLQVVSGDDQVAVPVEILATSQRTKSQTFAANAPHIYFLNFDGVTISPGGNDAQLNRSFIGQGGTVPPFAGTAAERAAVVDHVRGHYQGLNIQFVTSRPAAGDYAMIVVGGEPADIRYATGSGTAGVAPMDCADQMPRDVGFAFSARVKAFSGSSSATFVAKLARVISHEAGHTLGLPHTGNGCDIMSYSSCPSDETFLNQTIPMQVDSQGTCGFASINTYQELLSVLGATGGSSQPPPPPPPPPTDAVAPQVKIDSPTMDAQVQSTFTVVGSATDNVGVVRLDIYINGVLRGRKTGGFSGNIVQISGLPDGNHTLRFSAYDAAGNEGRATLKVSVGVPAPPPDTKPPLIVIDSPAEGAELEGKFQVRGSASDDVALDRLEFLVDGKQVDAKTSAPFSGVLFETALAAGSHQLTLRAYDTAGNSSEAKRTIIVKDPVPDDTTPPGVTINAPLAGATVGARFQVEAQIADDVGVVKAELYVDDALVATRSDAPFVGALFEVADLGDGGHQIKLVGVDAAGNRGEAIVQVTVDARETSSMPIGTPTGTPPADRPASDGPGLLGGCAVVGSAANGYPSPSYLLLALVFAVSRRRRLPRSLRRLLRS